MQKTPIHLRKVSGFILARKKKVCFLDGDASSRAPLENIVDFSR